MYTYINQIIFILRPKIEWFSIYLSNQIEKTYYTSLYTTFWNVKETHKWSIDGKMLNKRHDVKYIGKTYIDDE